jgi:hypothetical protein
MAPGSGPPGQGRATRDPDVAPSGPERVVSRRHDERHADNGAGRRGRHFVMRPRNAARRSFGCIRELVRSDRQSGRWVARRTAAARLSVGSRRKDREWRLALQSHPRDRLGSVAPARSRKGAHRLDQRRHCRLYPSGRPRHLLTDTVTSPSLTRAAVLQWLPRLGCGYCPRCPRGASIAGSRSDILTWPDWRINLSGLTTASEAVFAGRPRQHRNQDIDRQRGDKWDRKVSSASRSQ